MSNANINRYPHHQEAEQKNQAAQTKAVRRGESVDKANVSSLNKNQSLPPSIFSLFKLKPFEAQLKTHFPVCLECLPIIHSIRDQNLFFLPGTFTSIIRAIVTSCVFCFCLLFLGGSFSHLSTCHEPQGDVQAEGTWNNSR